MKEYMASTLTQEEIKVANAQYAEWARDGSEGGATKLAAANTDFLRTRVREGSIARNILKDRNVGPSDLVPSTTDDDPRYIGEIEPDTPGGIVSTIAGRPQAHYFFGKRYEARFGRLETPRQMKDTTQLLTYKTDLRQVLSDMNLKDLLSIQDTRFIQLVNNALAPTTLLPGEIVPQTGIIQWDTINAGITPNSVADALTIMNRGNSGIDVATVLVNLNFAKQLLKWGRDDFGGDMAEEVKRKGFTEREYMGVRWLITIKNWLVPDGTMFMFAPQEFIGETLVLTDATMHVRKEASVIDFWSYMEVAQVIPVVGGLARCDLLQAGWNGSVAA